MTHVNKFLEIDYTRYGNSSNTHFNQLTDEVIAKGLVKYLRKYYTSWAGKWTDIDVTGKFTIRHDFFHTAEIAPSRFYEIFKDENRKLRFLNLLKEGNVKTTLKYGNLTLIDLEHPSNS